MKKISDSLPMTPEQKAAIIVARSPRVAAKVAGMQVANMAALRVGRPLPHGPEDFFALEASLEDEALAEFFATP